MEGEEELFGMTKLSVAYDGLLSALAILSAILLGIVTLAVIADVTVRNMGLQPPAHTSAFVEYSLLYITLLASPWLLRKKGHVYIEIVIGAVGPRTRRIMATISYVLCIVTCLLLLVYSADLTVLNWTRGSTDIRSFDMPRWALFAPMPLCFLLMAVEFTRFLLGRDSLYSSGPPAL
jgi:TRAP-type C4-dicarboxylate transport system permease small subunit